MLTEMAVVILMPVVIVTLANFVREARAANGWWRKFLWLATLCTATNYLVTLVLTTLGQVQRNSALLYPLSPRARYNRNPNDHKLLAEALRFHDEEVIVANQIIEQNHAPLATPDSWFGVVETYQNHMDVRNLLTRSPQIMCDELERVEAMAATVAHLISHTGVGCTSTAIGEDAALYRQMFRIQQFDEAGRLDHAIELGDTLLWNISRSSTRGPFLFGKAHHLVGRTKPAMLRISKVADLGDSIIEHFQAAEACFTAFGNRRLLEDVKRDIRTNKLT